MSSMTMFEYAERRKELVTFESYCYFVLGHEILKALMDLKEVYQEVPIDWDKLGQALQEAVTLRETLELHASGRSPDVPALWVTVETAREVLRNAKPEDRHVVAHEVVCFLTVPIVSSRYIIKDYDKGLSWRIVGWERFLYWLVDVKDLCYDQLEFGEKAYDQLDAPFSELAGWFRAKREALVEEFEGRGQS